MDSHHDNSRVEEARPAVRLHTREVLAAAGCLCRLPGGLRQLLPCTKGCLSPGALKQLLTPCYSAFHFLNDSRLKMVKRYSSSTCRYKLQKGESKEEGSCTRAQKQG